MTVKVPPPLPTEQMLASRALEPHPIELTTMRAMSTAAWSLIPATMSWTRRWARLFGSQGRPKR